MSSNQQTDQATLEAQIANKVARKHCILTGRGATALFLAYSVLPEKKGRIILPAMLCSSPAYVAFATGHSVEFCDISEETLQMNPDDLERLLKKHNDVVAIVLVHIFGRAAPINELISIADKYNIPVIEDAAQALGGSYHGKMLGGFADVSILSFGHTKPVDIGWGGAFLTDDDELARKVRVMDETLTCVPENINERFEEYRQAYYLFIKDNNRADKRRKEYCHFLKQFHDIYVFRFNDEWCDMLAKGLSELDENVKKRRDNEELFYDALKHFTAIRLLPIDPEAVPWRFTVMLPAIMQHKVTAYLRDYGWDASNWYPSLTSYFESNEMCETACEIENQILNLWLEPKISKSYIQGVCDSLLEVLEKEKKLCQIST